MNIKLSFAKNEMADFDYALAFKKSLGMSFLLYATYSIKLKHQKPK